MKNIYIIPTNTCFGIACPISDMDSYKTIYKIKGRVFDKPLALLCMDLKYLEENTLLNKPQVNFIKDYHNPFTILLPLEKITDNNLLNIIKGLPNSEIYKKIAFRVNHSFMQRRLIEDKGILFLTSANKSNFPEILDTKEIKKQFKEDIGEYDIKVFAHRDFYIKSKHKSSDIFEFVSDGLDIEYLRKN